MTASGSPVRIRVARASDEAQLARLDRISWSPQSGFPSVIQQAGRVFFLTDSPPQAFLVGEIDGAIVGYIAGSPVPLPETPTCSPSWASPCRRTREAGEWPRRCWPPPSSAPTAVPAS